MRALKMGTLTCVVMWGGLLGGCAASSEPETGTPSEVQELDFESTFAALQSELFEGQGCTAGACHGESAAGGLDLTAGVSYAQLVEVASKGSALARVQPGDRRRSYLYLKLLAALEPDTTEVAGSPMPSVSAPIPSELLEALRLWIYAGAPETGTVIGTAELLGTELPAPEPLTIAPLPTPDPSEGIQFEMPPWIIPAGSEREVCFASYYDFRDQVPDEFKDETGEYGLMSIEELRQDPQSHHLILNVADVSVDNLHHASFGTWTCRGGALEGSECEPTDLDACGSGHCATEPKDGFACIGFGPPGDSMFAYTPIGGAQKAQDYEELPDGVYREVPLRGILYWNSHAFNLTQEDHMMNGRINFLYADNPQHQAKGLLRLASKSIFKPDAPPFERQEVCSTLVMPEDSHIISLTSHTHQRGEHFTIFLPDGSLIYENFIYNDPLRKYFDPPLVLDDETEEGRTLTYCAVYNNGVGPDGEPDPETVTRHSRMPDSVLLPGVPGNCVPEACVTGQLGAPCGGVGDDATCDSAPGAGDGWCDACSITGGESTENEMFLILGMYYEE